jgi:hypothetical protein
MTNYELAIDEDGEPFPVPPQVAGWRVKRALDGRGRPMLVHGRGPEKGKPLIVRANASHGELLAAAGPGKYRLEAVDELRRKIDGVPVACTGPLTAEDDSNRYEDSTPDIISSSPVRQSTSYEDVLCQVVGANTRMVEKAIGQMSAVMSSVAELLNAAHSAGITNRLPPPPPPPPPPVEVDHDQAPEAPDVSGFGMSDVLQMLIKEAVAKAVPMIFERLAGGGGGGSGGSLPFEAILDWRKAVPTPAAPAPAAPVAPSAPPVGAAGSASWAAASAPASYAPPPRPTYAAPSGAAPSHEPLGAVPAEGLTLTPAANAPQTHEDAANAVNAHVLQVWQGLTQQERTHATLLIARLTPHERAAWLAELAQLTVAEAITSARAVIHRQPSAPATLQAQLPAAPPEGEPA